MTQTKRSIRIEQESRHAADLGDIIKSHLASIKRIGQPDQYDGARIVLAQVADLLPPHQFEHLIDAAGFCEVRTPYGATAIERKAD